MPNAATASITTGSTTRVDSAPQPQPLPNTLSAHTSTGARSARWRESASCRAAFSRSAMRGSSWVPWFSRCRMRAANWSSFIASFWTPSQGNSARFQRHRQSMRRPGAVRFHAAFRASHDARRLRDVQFLPVTHKEGFALTGRQALELLLNDFKHLSLLELGPGSGRGLALARLIGFERVLFLVLAAAR